MKQLYIIFLVLIPALSTAQDDSKFRVDFLGETFITQVNGKYGMIDPDSNILIPHEYEAIYPDGGFTITKKDGKLGIFKLGQGVIFLPNEYEEIERDGSFIKTKKEGKYGLLHLDGKVLIPNEYEKMSKDGAFIYVTKNGKMGLYNLKGKLLINTEFESLKADGGVVLTQKESKFGLVSRKGKLILPNDFDFIDLTPNEARASKAGIIEGYNIKKYNKGYVYSF